MRRVAANSERARNLEEPRLCPAGHPMRVELSGKAVGSKGDTVTLWYCPACDHAEAEVRPV